jgi:phage shock protein PspC (stress-responsive transcriptional regulator)
MVERRPVAEDRVMTETNTPQDSRPDAGQEQSAQGSAPGVNTDHLRDYAQLRRSVSDRKIAGVAGGLGRHLNIDPTVIRVLLVVLVFFGGAGLLLYGAAWLIVPEDGRDEAVVNTTPSTRNALLIVAGVIAALMLIGDSWGGFGFPWPLVLIGLVVVIVLAARDQGGGGTTPAAPTAPGQQPAAPGSWAPPAEQTAGHPTDPAGVPPTGPPAWVAPTSTYPPAPSRPPKSERGPKLFGFTLAFVALALGVLGLYEASGGDVLDAAYPALALAVIGVMLVWGSFSGRPGGLILLGIIASLALAATSAAESYDYDGDRELDARPVSAAMVEDRYDIPAGSIGVDLTGVDDLENLDGRTIRVAAVAGQIDVLLPEGVDVDVTADIDVGGDIDVDGVRDEGSSPEVVHHIDGGDDVPTIQLELDLTVGEIDVAQVQEAQEVPAS